VRNGRELGSPHTIQKNIKFIAEKTNTKEICVTKEFGLFYIIMINLLQ
jgi:hypothetical protein